MYQQFFFLLAEASTTLIYTHDLEKIHPDIKFNTDKISSRLNVETDKVNNTIKEHAKSL